MLIYGGGSIKKNGIYDKVVDILKHNGKEIFEDGGVMPNPTAEKLRDGVEKARAAKSRPAACGGRRLGVRLCQSGVRIGFLQRGRLGQIFRQIRGR